MRAESSETTRRTLRDSGEDMVPSAWRHAGRQRNSLRSIIERLSKVSSEIPCRVSSDPHEWRNEMGAVSATYSAKLKYL